jgi:hypothetical protein
LLFFAAVLTACHRPVPVTQCVASLQYTHLSAIDTLMQICPDSALTLLLATPMDDPYYHLLLSEALYKNDSAQLNRKELLTAMACFDSIGIPFLSARCHYMNGVYYYETDSVVSACEEYMKALEIMEEHFSEKEMIGYKAKFIALTYTRLTNIFSDQYLHEQAFYFGKHALPYYNSYDAEPWHVAWMLSKIGTFNEMMEQYDSAGFYYREAKTTLKDTTILMHRDIETHLAYLSYKTEKNALTPLNRLHRLLSQAKSEKEFLARCLVIGEIYYQEKNNDSTVYYFQKVFDASSNANSKTLSAQRLKEICSKTNDTASSNDYDVYLLQQNFAIDIQAHLHTQLTQLHHDFTQKKAEKLHLQHQKKMTNWNKNIIVILLVILVLLIVFRSINKRRYRHLKAQQSAITGRLKQSNKQLRELTQRVNQQEKEEPLKSEMFAATFLDESICQLILKKVNEGHFKSQMDYTVYKDYALGKKDILNLRKAADHHFDRFTYRLSKSHPSLTNSDLDYCCLHLLGLSDADLSALMQRAYNTINERNKKLKGIFSTEKALSVILQDIANSKE